MGKSEQSTHANVRRAPDSNRSSRPAAGRGRPGPARRRLDFQLKLDAHFGDDPKAKAAGVYKGRPPSIEASRVCELKAQGMRPSDIAKALKIGRASVYRLLAQAS
jgi:hypothetical protein